MSALKVKECGGVIGALVIGCVMSFVAGCNHDGSTSERHAPKPYLMMVTSRDPPLMKLSQAQVELLNQTPFDGVAISIMGIYDGGPLPDERDLLARCGELRGSSLKTIWPRFYLNRMIGFLPKNSPRKACSNPGYFDKIKGFDLWNEAGARDDFLALWRRSLRSAKALGAPGVVADFESYNCRGLANPQGLASACGRSLEETQDSLRELGSKLADITAEEFPQACIWSLMTELGVTDWYWNKPPRDPPILALHAYIFEGLLQRAKERAIPLTLISGGEDDIGYYHSSVEALKQKIAAKAEAHRAWIERFKGYLVLGGTIVVWNDDTKLSGWTREAAGASPPYKCFADFTPIFSELFHAYDYVWLYVPMTTDYNPFDPKSASELNIKLSEAIAKGKQRRR